MKSTPLISIIIAHYNLADYIYEAIASCLNQTYKNIEVIVVDDYSSDQAALKKIYGLRKKYPKVKLIKNTVNKGSAKTYNIGVEEAKGEYICCLDADDKFQKTFIEKALKCFLCDPSLGFITSWMRIFGDSSSIEKTPSHDVSALLIRNLFSSASMFSKKAWTKIGGFDPEMKTYRDWDFWISLVEKGYRWEVLVEPLILYRDRKSSASKLSVEKNI
ncbi:MAG: Glycosyl transferase family 2 [Candidatus Roizmanbacteria bacterium GW2011_GWC2_37_13]|uniref:Glycosyl transferase family 2 n=1 Tax=Candidatus Roizmanbacteria bacterium GW2011_GWC2_37_13 TaxID=1618486 RepID=A0A0G0G0L2_9BACT|nr:MAG: Glycosyl transferase family 2 [Candidatus Roizmanbacteria bacterium GW2011_GWC1_37_12]KKQ24738.1 MAG: Glycosyl transferase family 2 [Candidatus Roizmanbacteria bacterium GW2011_GWC2_37_13]